MFGRLRLNKKILSLLTSALTLVFVAGSAAAQGQYIGGSIGIDASWPNCSQSLPRAGFGIVGVTGGKNFSQNPCFKAQASRFTNLSLYTNTGYPGQSYAAPYQNAPRQCAPSDAICMAYNYGYNAAQYALNYANSQGVASSTWWLDVETMNTWINDTAQNQSSLQGQIDALKAAGVVTVGIYSTTAQWGTITGGWQNGLPSWGATTWTTAKQAATYCKGHEFTGGPSYLMQYLPRKDRLDYNVAC